MRRKEKVIIEVMEDKKGEGFDVSVDMPMSNEYSIYALQGLIYKMRSNGVNDDEIVNVTAQTLAQTRTINSKNISINVGELLKQLFKGK